MVATSKHENETQTQKLTINAKYGGIYLFTLTQNVQNADSEVTKLNEEALSGDFQVACLELACFAIIPGCGRRLAQCGLAGSSVCSDHVSGSARVHDGFRLCLHGSKLVLDLFGC